MRSIRCSCCSSPRACALHLAPQLAWRRLGPAPLSRLRMPDRLRALLLVGILSFSALTVYTQYVFLQTTDHVTGRPFRDTSLDEYHEILDGRRPFPYQWRVAGPWLVQLGEVAT